MASFDDCALRPMLYDIYELTLEMFQILNAAMYLTSSCYFFYFLFHFVSFHFFLMERKYELPKEF